MIYLHKILPLLVMPLSITLFIIVIGLVRKKPAYCWGALIFIYMCATPFVADHFFSWVESSGGRLSMTQVKKADAIVVLGGMAGTVQGKDSVYAEWSDPDRFFAGIELYKQKKAPYLIFNDGKLPWEKGESEGKIVSRQALAMGVDPRGILLTDPVQHTADEAKAVQALLKQNQQRIILVTSAFHMPRAQRVFEEQGFLVQPFPVDYKVGNEQRTFLDFFPKADALRTTEMGLRELVGRLYYSVR